MLVGMVSKPAIRRIGPKLLLFCVSALLSLVVAEVILRVIYKQHYRNGLWEASYKFVQDDRLIYRLRPNAMTTLTTSEFDELANTNKESIRGGEISFTKPAGAYRVVVVGDSFTFGHGLDDDETYPSRLEDILTASVSAGRPIEVINMGVPGYTPDQEYRQIMEEVPKYRPDMVIWNLISYDFDDMFGALPALYGMDESETNLVVYDGRLNWMYIRDALYNHAPYFVRKSYVFDLLLSRLSAIYVLRRKPPLTVDTQLDWAEKKLMLELRSAGKTLKQNKIMFVVVHLPVDQEFNSGTNYATSMFNGVFTETGRKLTKLRIPFIDVEEEIKLLSMPSHVPSNSLPDTVLTSWGIDLSRPRKLFYAVNGHPNANGAVVMASIVAEHLLPMLSKTGASMQADSGK
jgi:lysophospholipase L1-like esterase